MSEEFHIYPCKICGKTPIISKNLEIEDNTRYKLSHCSVETNGLTETQCIVNWNNYNRKEVESENGGS